MDYGFAKIRSSGGWNAHGAEDDHSVEAISKMPAALKTQKKVSPNPRESAEIWVLLLVFLRCALSLFLTAFKRGLPLPGRFFLLPPIIGTTFFLS